MKASSEIIEQMASDIAKCVSALQDYAEAIRSAASQTQDWDDRQGIAFNQTMQDIASLTDQPVQDLEAAIPKLRELAQIVDEYNSIGF